jgi:hypothetical protein
MRNGFGKLNFVYASVFKNSGTLLTLDPPEFRKSKNTLSSMNNPDIFAAFFKTSSP